MIYFRFCASHNYGDVCEPLDIMYFTVLNCLAIKPFLILPIRKIFDYSSFLPKSISRVSCFNLLSAHLHTIQYALREGLFNIVSEDQIDVRGKATQCSIPFQLFIQLSFPTALLCLYQRKAGVILPKLCSIVQLDKYLRISVEGLQLLSYTTAYMLPGQQKRDRV